MKRYHCRKGEVGTKIRCSSHYRFNSSQEFRSLVQNRKGEGDQTALSPLPLMNRIMQEKAEDVRYLFAYNPFQRKLGNTSGTEMVTECNGSSEDDFLNENFEKCNCLEKDCGLKYDL
ncbi:hypothetical protein AVEN_188580-1 [Araneus ventricosus]|uniref:Uncharacterized protein n=1 Tax=Araneus ventricosus TaxID=182803 RepID=A0A4Y2HRS2_ARAVE|nr:hypothetical protein AVEN_188580-1 [Araneus ventricosus]